MRNSLPDVHTLERLLGGRVEPDDAPPGYAEVARVLRALATLPGHVDLNREDEDIAAARILVAHRPLASGRSDGSSQRMRSSRHRVKVFGLVVVGTVLGTFGFAAAGVLPDAAQDALSNVLAHVGISVPRSDHPATSESELSEMPTTSNSTGMGKGGEISQIATTTTSTGVDKGAEISSVASDGKSQAGDHGFEGNGGRAAPVPAPNAGGTSTAGTASDGHSHVGTDIADQKSGGRSAAGSGNRSSAGH